MANDTIRRSLKLVLRPVVSFCLRNGLRIQDLTASVREVFLELACDQLVSEGVEASASRLSVATGIHRKFIPALLKKQPPAQSSRSMLIRLIETWQRDRRFSKDKVARTLSVQHPHGDFFALVNKVSADLNPYTVLSELERRGVVSRSDNLITLQERFLVISEDLVEALNIVSADASDLLCATEENITQQKPIKHLQLSTEYDNIAPIHAEKIRSWLLAEGSDFHARARSFLSPLDRDITPSDTTDQARLRVKLGAFSFVDDATVLKKGKV